MKKGISEWRKRGGTSSWQEPRENQKRCKRGGTAENGGTGSNWEAVKEKYGTEEGRVEQKRAGGRQRYHKNIKGGGGI